MVVRKRTTRSRALTTLWSASRRSRRASRSSTARSQFGTELTQQQSDSKNMSCAADPCHGRYLTSHVRLSLPRPHVDQGGRREDAQRRQQNSPYFAEWIPNGLIKSPICNIPPNKGLKTPPWARGAGGGGGMPATTGSPENQFPSCCISSLCAQNCFLRLTVQVRACSC